MEETKQPRPLTIRDVKFCQLYVTTGNGTRAFRDAGFPAANDSVAANGAWRLLRNAQIRAYIRELRQAAVDAAKATVEAIAQGMARLAFADRSDLFDERGRLKPPKDWPADVAATVESVETDEIYEVVSKSGEPKRRELRGYTRKVRTGKRAEALRLLAQWRRMIGNDAEQGKAAPDPLVIGGEADPSAL